MSENARTQEQSTRAAGQYALNVMKRYVEDIHMAAYPQTPSQVGGPLYDRISVFFNEVAARQAKGEPAVDIALSAVEALRHADDSKETSAYGQAYFKQHRENAEKLMSGVSPEELLSVLKESDNNSTLDM